MLAVRVKLLILIIMVAILTGCWDRIEMEDRAFVIGVAIDKAEDDGGKYLITYQIALPGGMATGGEGGGDEPSWNISTVSDSMAQATRSMGVRVGRVINFHHLQLLVISEDVAREGISDFMDFFFRDFESRLHTTILISTDGAKKILEVQPKTGQALSIYLANSVDINKSNAGIAEADVKVGEVIGNLTRGNDFPMPRATPGEDEIKVAGAAVFVRDRMEAWLGERETKHLRFIRGEIDRASVKLDNIQGRNISVLVTQSSTKTSMQLRDNNLYIKTRIRVEGDIEEVDNVSFDTLDAKFIREVEQAFIKQIRQGCLDLIDKAKNDMGAEFFDFGHKVKNHYPKYWRSIEEDWREVFKEVVNEVEVEFSIRRLGLIR